MTDPMWTKDEVLEEAGRVRDMLREMFNEHGQVRAVTWLYSTRNPETGAVGKGLVLMPNIGRFDPSDRQLYAFMIRKVGQICRAQGVIFASEVWTIDPEYHKQVGYEAAVKEAREWVGSLERHPHRMEAIFVNLEHQRVPGHRIWYAKITRDAEGKGILGEWNEEHWEGDARNSGRFLNMLPPVN